MFNCSRSGTDAFKNLHGQFPLQASGVIMTFECELCRDCCQVDAAVWAFSFFFLAVLSDCTRFVVHFQHIALLNFLDITLIFCYGGLLKVPSIPFFFHLLHYFTLVYTIAFNCWSRVLLMNGYCIPLQRHTNRSYSAILPEAVCYLPQDCVSK